jgi:cytochrome d ubiquinol oxidase subunit II
VRSGAITILVAAVFLLWTNLAHGQVASWLLALLAAVLLIGSFFANLRGRERYAFGLMAGTIAIAVASLFAALFPNVMPASNDVANSLTIANASSTPYTLSVMSWVAVAVLPFVLGYQAYTYWVFRKRITRASIPEDTQPLADSPSASAPVLGG